MGGRRVQVGSVGCTVWLLIPNLSLANLTLGLGGIFDLQTISFIYYHKNDIEHYNSVRQQIFTRYSSISFLQSLWFIALQSWNFFGMYFRFHEMTLLFGTNLLHIFAAQQGRNLPGGFWPKPRLARIFGRTLTQVAAQRRRVRVNAGLRCIWLKVHILNLSKNSTQLAAMLSNGFHCFWATKAENNIL